MNRKTAATAEAKAIPRPTDDFDLVENVATRLFNQVTSTFDGMVVVAYRRKRKKREGEISSTMLSTRKLNKTDRKFLRKLILQLPEICELS